MRRLHIHLYDNIFAAGPSGGNACWVVPAADGLSDARMQAIARELALPATAFVSGANDEAPTLRFFSPAREFSMCGHAVVAAACTLVDRGDVRLDRDAAAIRFQTMAGEIVTHAARRDYGPVQCTMVQRNPWFRPAGVPAERLAALLGLPPDCLDSGLPLETGSTGLKHLFVPVLSKEAMAAMTPDFARLRELSESLDVESVAVHSTDTADPGINARIRDFCPAIGVNEEPASGTTNGAVGSYLVRHGRVATDANGDAHLVALQGVEMGKPSRLETHVHVDRSGTIDLVRVGGSARPSREATIDRE